MMSQGGSLFTDHDRIQSLQSIPINCDGEEPERIESNSIANCGVIRLEDVVCGRGKVAFSHAGNMRFRDAIECSVDPFMRATTKEEKAAIVQSVIDKVTSVGGRFLRHDFHKKRWVELSSQQRWEKVGHALRDTARAACRKRETSNKSLDASPSKDSKESGLQSIKLLEEILYSSSILHPTITTDFNYSNKFNTENSIFNSEELVPNFTTSAPELNFDPLWQTTDSVPGTFEASQSTYISIDSLRNSSAPTIPNETVDISTDVLNILNETADQNDSSRFHLATVQELSFDDSIGQDDFLKAIKSALAPVSTKNKISSVFDTMHASMGSLQLSCTDLSLDVATAAKRDPLQIDTSGIETMSASMMSLGLSCDSLYNESTSTGQRNSSSFSDSGSSAYPSVSSLTKKNAT